MSSIERGSTVADQFALEVESVNVAYGQLQVLFDVSIDVAEGVATALLGTNGAGKSTLLRAIAGLVPIASGRVRFGGQDITKMTPPQRTRLGMTLVEGGRAVFPTLSVRENLRLGGYPFLRDKRRIQGRIDRVLGVFPALEPYADRSAGMLSGGEQQMLAIGRALVPEPQLLVIDELSLGLAPVVMQQLVAVVENIVSEGTTVVLVEQSLNVALAIAKQAFFMEKGQVRFSGPTEELLDRGDLVRSVFFGDRTATA